MNRESAVADVKPSRRPFYSWAWRVLLLAILAAIGYELGKPRGLDYGYESEIDVPADEKYELRTYYVGDIISLREVEWSWNGSSWVIKPIDGYDEMENLIIRMIDTIDWDVVGGDGHIEINEDTRNIIVYQTPRVHDQIAALFAQVREVARANDVVLTPPTAVAPDTGGSDMETSE